MLTIPIFFSLAFVIGPLAIMVVVSFWARQDFTIVPAFQINAYAEFLGGVRTAVLQRTVLTSFLATALSLVIAYPIAYLLARLSRPAVTRIVLLLLTIPFLINYIIRNFAWAFLLGRNGPINHALIGLGVTDAPVDWLLYSTFSVYVGLVASYMPFMVFPLWLSLAGIDRRLIEASYLLGASPVATFLRVTLPLSLPGLFAAVIFALVGILGESAVSLILGGAGYELMGNTITSAMNVLDYPLAAAMSTVTVALMVVLLVLWYALTDIRSFLGQIMGRG
ncbi:ABC transporter permease [Mesorhizobium sp. WSM4976]|uniref:ABC transporter permease n=1 Tax=Mesorhizobium sp. WSM4976 TaxID=3038549 RepID=UPI002416737D|nr:ABC transporter permease [Mesorhizobium sp. WSM4976]MDG4898395.1 ABC transporter permease [Mesorhizobium sp. WSM4976]